MSKVQQNASRLVSFGYALLVVAGLVWSVFGTGILHGSHLGNVTGRWLDHDATVMAVPWIAQLPWFGLMAGLGIYAVWQCTPTARHTDLHGRLRILVLAVVFLNALWLQLLERDRLGASLVLGAVLLAVLVLIVVMIDRTVLHNHMDRWITRASFGLFTGWLGVVLLGQFIAWLASRGMDPVSMMFKGGSALGLLLIALFLCAVTFKNPMGIYVNAGALWVIAWLTVDRFAWDETSPMFGTVCLVAAVLMLVCLGSSVRTRLRRLLAPSSPPPPSAA